MNVIGTANVVKLCMQHGLRLTYISTDYVFRGDRGEYREEDPVYPVNKYAWSKLGGECAVRLYDRALIIRTSFGADEFPYGKAFVDQWTSRERVSVIAPMIVNAVQAEAEGMLHIGGAREGRCMSLRASFIRAEPSGSCAATRFLLMFPGTRR